MKSLRLPALFATACLSPLLQGCGGGGHYYRVTDPKSGETYYTQAMEWDVFSNDAATKPSTFVDARSGKRVTLDRTRVDVLDQHEFDAGVSRSVGG